MKQNILEVLKDKYEALDLIAINDLLNLNTPNELKELELTLAELVNEYKVYKTKKDKYILFENCKDLKAGKLSINKAGNGYVLLEPEDLYVNYHNLNGAVNGDIVLTEIFTYKGQKEGRILKILKRDTKNIIGEVIFKDKHPYLKLEDSKKRITVELDPKTTQNCVEGTKVVVNLVKEKTKNNYLGTVATILGHKDDPHVDIKTIAYKHEIYEEFSAAATEQTNKMPIMVEKNELINRKDLTGEVIFTIDGDDTKDIDDAVSIKKNKNTYTLGVHIADVSYYVKKDSPLDIDAFKRGTSSYLADSVIPMLPHKLSNGICSLNPNVIRLTISCVMEIDLKGNVIKYDIFPSYIKSAKKMTYQKVNDILMRNIIAEDYDPYVDKLKDMNTLAHILRKNKEQRGYIDFNIDEAKIICDKDGKCLDIKKNLREDGEKLIEDFMIAANETVASHIYNMNLPFIYRVHGEPKQEKIDRFIGLVNIMGYKLVGKYKNLKPTQMQKILNQIKDKPEAGILSEILLRSMQKAVYSKDNIGHFGLGSMCYTHFTSPIRRYPDLIVHRLLRTYLFDKKIDNETIDYWEANLDFMALNCSNREQAAVEAEREVNDMKKAEYMENHIGEVYEGIITTLTNFGMFVQLDNLIEGLVHINTLEDDYYSYIPEAFSLIGQRTKKRYRLGDKIKVKCISASKVAKTIDFVVLDGDKRGNKKSQSIL
jgi:ribonuclease R